jgi:cytidylate kinase
MTSQESDDALRRLLEVRIREWLMSEKDPGPRPRSVVTITEEPGCGGEAIAKLLCTELGLHLYSSELVKRIAEDAHVSDQLVSSLEEQGRSELEEWLAEFHGNPNLTSQAYLDSLKRVLFAIAAHGNAVIVGRGGNFLLPPDKRIGLCLVAPLEERLERTMKDLGVPEKVAREHISKLEAKHRRLVKEYFQEDILDATQYHLVVNTALLKPETIVQMVKSALAEPPI